MSGRGDPSRHGEGAWAPECSSAMHLVHELHHIAPMAALHGSCRGRRVEVVWVGLERRLVQQHPSETLLGTLNMAALESSDASASSWWSSELLIQCSVLAIAALANDEDVLALATDLFGRSDLEFVKARQSRQFVHHLLTCSILHPAAQVLGHVVVRLE